MHARALLPLLATVCFALAGCAPAASTPQPAPAPQAAAPAPGAPTTQESAAADWSRIVEAAKREGKVTIIGPQGAEARESLSQGFQRKYPEIQVDYSGMAGAMVPPKVINELGADQFLTDLVIAGTTTLLEGLQPAGAIVPIEPYLVGPHARERAAWRDGKLHFADDQEQYVLFLGVYAKEGFAYNPELVNPAEFTSYRDLLNPKWKGKIAMRDPRLAGGSVASLTFYYVEPSLGKDFIRQLFTQEIPFSNDDRQMLDWVAQGRYPIAIGIGNTLANDYMDRGLPIRMLDTAGLREGTYLTSGAGSLAVVRNAPHPNALKVYLDYLLSVEGQTEWSRAAGLASLRRDVPSDHVPSYFTPKEGVQYVDISKERYVRLRDEVQEYVKSVSGR
jgi:iron(III) transport system substrate-binding protein